MKIIGIGDFFIPAEFIDKGFASFKNEGYDVSTISWNLKDVEEFQHINLLVEQGGSEVYDVPQDILDKIKDADIIITQFCPMSKKVIDNCPNLKAIGVLRGGIENINKTYASEKGILVFNTPGRNATAVADFTVGMLLSEVRNIAKAHAEMKKGNWVHDFANASYVMDLEGKTAGIIGYGNIGAKVAKRLKAFGVEVIAYDPYYKGDEVKLVDLPTLMKESDFVLVHYRLTEETKHMINKELIGMMKPTAYLINTARSGLVDEKALADALNNHKIFGAALDVFDLEPPGADYPLVKCDNVTITPHLAGSTKDAFLNSPLLLANEMKKAFKGERTGYLMNKDSCANNPLIK